MSLLFLTLEPKQFYIGSSKYLSGIPTEELACPGWFYKLPEGEDPQKSQNKMHSGKCQKSNLEMKSMVGIYPTVGH
jgi:hypothetical protein